MIPSAAVPRDLRIVALLFLLSGINSALTMVVGFMTGQIRLEFGFISIFAFFGLLHLSRGWRLYALFMIWWGIVISPVIIILGLTTNLCTFNIFTLPVTQIPPLVGAMVSLVIFFLLLWQLKVLTRREIKALFQA